MAKQLTKWGKKRIALRMKQGEFWARVGISQSGGSRYEQGQRNVYPAVEICCQIAYGTPAARKRALKQLLPAGA